MAHTPLYSNSKLGYFRPSFFFIEVNSSSDLISFILDIVREHESPLPSDNPGRIFLHEYVHYLQDIASVYGHINMSNTVNIMRAATEVLRYSGLAEFTSPIDVFEYKPLVINADLFSTYHGDTETSSDFAEEPTIESISLLPYDVKHLCRVIDQVVIQFEDGTDYCFGAHAILEGMASIVEEHIVGRDESAPFFPYRIFRAFTEHMLQSVWDDIFLVALAECSLQHFHPGLFLYETLSRMREADFRPDAPSDIACFMFDDLPSLRHSSRTFITHQEFVAFFAENAIRDLSDWFQSPHSVSPKTYVANVINQAHSLRVDSPVFLTEIFFDPLFGDRFQNELLYVLETPPIFNSLGQSWMLTKAGNAMEMNQFRAVWEIFVHLNQPETSKCGMVKFCSRAEYDCIASDLINYRCLLEPWANAERSHLCPYGMLWKIWGLSGKKLVIADSPA